MGLVSNSGTLAVVKLIVGQGNPGAQYARSKHNVGFWLMDQLSSQYRIKGKTWLAQENGVLLLKPTTYYNLTGEAIAPLVHFYKIDPSDVLVIHDELDLAPGRLRYKMGGSNAGNNGLKSITAHLGTTEFCRLRIGVGKPPVKEAGADWVLTGFHPEVQPLMELSLKTALEVVQLWREQGHQACKTRYSNVLHTIALEAPTAEPHDA